MTDLSFDDYCNTFAFSDAELETIEEAACAISDYVEFVCQHTDGRARFRGRSAENVLDDACDDPIRWVELAAAANLLWREQTGRVGGFGRRMTANERRELLELVDDGVPYTAVAARIGVSAHTVRRTAAKEAA